MALKEQTASKSQLRLVFLGLAAITLAIGTMLQDPINAPKIWILLVLGSWLSGQVIGEIVQNIRGKNFTTNSRLILFIGSIFIFANSISLFMTDSKYVGLFGDYQRRTGFLTYLFLVIFFWYVSLKIRFSDLARFHYWTLGIALTFCSYGIFQHIGMDFLNWVNPYNSVLGTVGNPNFAAALMGIFSVILFGFGINSGTSLLFRAISIGSALLLLLTIHFSDSLQGFLVAAVGFGVLIVTWILQRNRALGWSIASFGFVGGLISVFGILQMGPFSFLFKESVTYRGDYWRAGLRMFQDHFWFGVGLDRYGAYFREYRDVEQVLRRGPNVVTNAAHNVFIQIGATGGVFVLLAYLVLVGFVFWRGIVGLRQNIGARQILFATFFAAWLTYMAQAIISIDNIALAIWGWVLGGAVVGLSYNKEESSKSKKAESSEISGIGLLISCIATLVAIVFSSFFFTAENAQRSVAKYAKPANVAQQQSYEEIVEKSIRVWPTEPKFRLFATRFFFEAGMNEQAVGQLTKAIENDLREFESRDTLARYYEQNKRPELALPIREYIVTIDPYNVINLLALGRDLKATGDVSGAREIVDRIAAIAPESEELKSAKSELLG
jgi:O-antigen ligase